MAIIEFDLRERPHAAGEKTKGYFPVVARPETVAPEALYAEMEHGCTLTRADIAGVVTSLGAALTRHLSAGRRVELPGIGSFAPMLRSGEPIACSDDKQAARHIRVGGVSFRPKRALVESMGGARFHRTASPRHAVPAFNDEETVALLRRHFASAKERLLTRRDFQRITGYARTSAQKALRGLTERGVLRRVGRPNSPLYLLSGERGQP